MRLAGPRLVALGVLLVAARASSAQKPSGAVPSEVQKGVQALEQGRFSEAEEYLSKALAAEPNLPEVRANLGLAYYVDHKYSEAVDAFREALRQQPSLSTAQTFLPLSLAALDECKEAIPGLRREFPNYPDVKLRRVIGLSLERCLSETGQPADASDILQKLVAQYPDDLDVLYEAGQFYGKLSSEMYLRLMKVAPDSARGYQVMGQVAASDGNWQRAVEAFRQAIRKDPRLPGVHLNLAVQLLLHSPDPQAWKEALENLNAEQKLSPADSDVYFEMGEAYRKHGQIQEAMASFREALRLRPGMVEARLGLAKALREQGMKEEAVNVLEPARETDPDNAAVHFLLAQLYHDLGRASEAEAEVAAFKRLQPSSP